MSSHWALYAIGMILLLVMLMFGMSLISTGQEDVPPEVLVDPGYQGNAGSADILLMATQGIPWALAIIALVGAFAYLSRRH
jgi:hypothetical protein